MQGEFRPEFRPKWTMTGSNTWVPDIDEATGLQRVEGVETSHTLVWPSGPRNSRITQEAWFSLGHTGEIGSKIQGRILFINQAGNLEKAVDFALSAHVRQWWGLPPNLDKVRVVLSAGRTESVGWCWEKLAKVV